MFKYYRIYNLYSVHVKKNYHLYDVQIIIELPPNYNCFDSLFEDLISVKLGVLVKKRSIFLSYFIKHDLLEVNLKNISCFL
jgi:hypothetical protein